MTDLKSNKAIHVEKISKYLIEEILESCEFNDEDKSKIGLE